jgi:EmrB/QacA subfamily drug resistance transporter
LESVEPATTSLEGVSWIELDERRWKALPVILVAAFMGLFDVFVVNVAAPDIQTSVHASAAELQLIIGGYAFTYAAFLVTGGRLGDRVGYRGMFIGGMIVFTLASAACGISQTPLELVVARLAQGLAAALMVPQVLAQITALFPPLERRRALAWFGVTIGLGAITGQVIGGALVQADLFGWGWRTVFFVNVPIGVITVLFAARLLPDKRSAARPQLDLVGVLLVSGSLGLALVPLTLGRSEGWPAWMVVLLCAALPAFALAIRYEARLVTRGGQPVLDLALFKARSFTAGLIVNAGMFAYFGSVLLGLTLFLQLGLGLSPLDAGLSFAPLGVSFAITSLLAQPLIARHGARVVSAGLVLALTALIGLLLDVELSGDATDPARLAPVFFAIGLGNGIVMPALIGVSLSDVPPQKAGAAAGSLATSQQFATAAGVAALSEIFFAALGSHPTRHSYIHAVELVLALDIALVGACFLASQLLPRPAHTRAAEAKPVEAGDVS